MATKPRAVIHPIAIQNTRPLLEDAHTFRRIPVYVSILPPVDTADMDEEQIKEVPDMVKALIQEEYDKLPRFN